MTLPQLFDVISERIARLDPDLLWPGFTLCPIAVYDHETVVTADGTFPWDDRFVGNTAIPWAADYLAIWRITELPKSPDALDRLAASLVHEAFHADQHRRGEDRFAHEFEAVCQLRYTPESVQLKLNENRVIARMAETLDLRTFDAFRTARVYRRRMFPEAVAYEEAIEWIEGAATSVELRALSLLNPDEGAKMRARLIARITDLQRQIPTRPLSYDVGAVLIDTFRRHEVPFDATVGPGRRPYLDPVLEGTHETHAMVCISDAVAQYVHADAQALKQTIDTARTQGTRIDPAIAHTLEMFNAYAPRYLDGWLWSEGFLATADRDGHRHILSGNCAAEWDGETLGAVYQMDADGF